MKTTSTTPSFGLALALAACFGSAPQARYYTLDGHSAEPALAGSAPAPWPITLAVERFSTSLVYDRFELVYRPNARELRFDAYRLWVAKPGRLLGEAVAEHLRTGAMFRAVVGQGSGRAADYELRGEVLAIEEVDQDAEHWRARLALRFELVRVHDDAVVWRHAFADERAVPELKTASVVATLDALLGDALVGLDAGLQGWFATNLPAPSERPTAQSGGTTP